MRRSPFSHGLLAGFKLTHYPKKHVADLDSEISAFANRKPYRIVLEPRFDPKIPAMVNVTVRVKEQMPEDFALILGDAIHNLRSALDLAVCCAVPGGASDPSVQFPFTKDAAALEATIKQRHINRAGTRIIELIRSLKPYAGGA